jgi:hypothetical protein
MLECQQDIPSAVRSEWAQDALRHITNPKAQRLVRQAIRRLHRGGKRAKYPVVYSIQPLLREAFQAPSNLHLLDRTLLQVRLTTLMRSADAANIVWALFHQDGEHYIKCTTKTGHLETFSVRGQTLDTVLEYVHKHRDSPALFMFRSTVKPYQCLGAERLAKRMLAVMDTVGINTETFKAHSLRGATATHLLRQGVSHHLVKTRGAWSSSDTLDQYYNRLHQSQDWERLLEGENASGRQSAERAVLPSSASQSEPDEGRGSGEDKRASTARAEDLDALGVRRPLYDSDCCNSCFLPMVSEATYTCQRCQQRQHVRCMGHHASVGERQFQYLTTCYLCTMTLTLPSAPSAPTTFRPPSPLCTPSSDRLIEDPMGVCS